MILILIIFFFIFFFFNDTATTEIYTLSLHDALPIRRAAEPDAARDRPRLRAGESRPAPRHHGGGLPSRGAAGDALLPRPGPALVPQLPAGRARRLQLRRPAPRGRALA